MSVAIVEGEEAQALLRAREEESSRLYPPESQYHIPARDHARDDVRFVVVREDGAAIGCGALELHAGYAEMKSVYLAPHARGRRLGAAIVRALEAEARRLGFDRIRLETGVRSPWAIGTYERAGYRRRGPFGAYPDDPLSVFMEKRLEGEGEAAPVAAIAASEAGESRTPLSLRRPPLPTGR